MPHYDYHCSNCGHQEEVFQKMTDKPLTQCPQCQQSSLRRGPGGGTGLLFQGSGFYITDYDTERPKEKDSKEPAPKKGPDSSSSCCPCGNSNPCS